MLIEFLLFMQKCSLFSLIVDTTDHVKTVFLYVRQNCNTVTCHSSPVTKMARAEHTLITAHNFQMDKI